MIIENIKHKDQSPLQSTFDLPMFNFQIILPFTHYVISTENEHSCAKLTYQSAEEQIFQAMAHKPNLPSSNSIASVANFTLKVVISN